MNFGPFETSIGYLMLIRTRYIFMALTTSIVILITVIIWFRSKKKLQISLLFGYILSWLFLLTFVQEYQVLSKIGIYMSLIPIISWTITFIFVHFQKRLRNKLNASWIAIGTVIYLASQLLRNMLLSIGPGEWGLSWVAELIDLIGWTIIFLGFYRIHGSTKKNMHNNVTPEILE